jgi:Fe-S-cluster containining protein
MNCTICPTLPRPYFAFPSGSITYNCEPCGQCCKGPGVLGIGATFDEVRTHDYLKELLPLVDENNTRQPMVSLFNFSDGCRHLGNNNRCNIHERLGVDSKPLTCRLFPFSYLVVFDGMPIVLPHAECPWEANLSKAPDPLSAHDDLLPLFTDQKGFLMAELTPRIQPCLSPLGANKRLILESAIRDNLHPAAQDTNLAQSFNTMRRLQEDMGVDAWPPTLDADLWSDLLRCAGEPQPLSARHEALVKVCLPSLRILWGSLFPLSALPTALEAFVFWLRSLSELTDNRWQGNDVLALAHRGQHLARLLLWASHPMPKLYLAPPTAAWAPFWDALRSQNGTPLGLALLSVLKPIEQGALIMLVQFGHYLSLHESTSQPATLSDARLAAGP